MGPEGGGIRSNRRCACLFSVLRFCVHGCRAFALSKARNRTSHLQALNPTSTHPCMVFGYMVRMSQPIPRACLLSRVVASVQLTSACFCCRPTCWCRPGYLSARAPAATARARPCAPWCGRTWFDPRTSSTRSSSTKRSVGFTEAYRWIQSSFRTALVGKQHLGSGRRHKLLYGIVA